MTRFALTSRPLLLLVVAMSMVAGACGSSSADENVYKDPDDRSLFEIPDDWNLYDAGELSQLDQVPLAPQFSNALLPIVSTVGFDGAPGRNITNLDGSVALSEYPVGAQVIRSIGEVERDQLSRALLADAVIPLQQLENVQDIVKEDYSFGDGYEGVRRFVGFTPGNGATAQGAVYFVTVTNDDDTLLYSMAAGCSVTCFQQYQSEIQEVVDSWLVNTNP